MSNLDYLKNLFEKPITTPLDSVDYNHMLNMIIAMDDEQRSNWSLNITNQDKTIQVLMSVDAINATHQCPNCGLNITIISNMTSQLSCDYIESPKRHHLDKILHEVFFNGDVTMTMLSSR